MGASVGRCTGILRQSFPRSCVGIEPPSCERSRDAGASVNPLELRGAGDDGRSSLRQSWLLFPWGAELGPRRSTGALMRPDGLLLLKEPLPTDPRGAGEDGRSSLRQSWLLFPCGAEIGPRRSTGAVMRPDGLLLFKEPLPTDPRGVPKFGERLQSGLPPPACPRWPGFETPVPAPEPFDRCTGGPS